MKPGRSGETFILFQNKSVMLVLLPNFGPDVKFFPDFRVGKRLPYAIYEHIPSISPIKSILNLDHYGSRTTPFGAAQNYAIHVREQKKIRT